MSSDVSTTCNQIYSKILELEKELRNLLKKKSAFDKSVVALRNSIRDEYEKLLFLDYNFALSKDVEQNLWKTVFYKVIEEYRKRIRKFVPPQNGDKLTSLPKDSGSKEELNRICESFRSFLLLASKFYQDLIGKLQSKYNLILDGSMDHSEQANLHPSFFSCHRCLIFLGDLARYHRDLYGHAAQKDWTKAASYYQQALQLVPDNGNPHNQLAVLATYADDEFNAVYHYFLSLAVFHPFLTAKDNLSVLFEKNRSKLQSEESTTKPVSSPKRQFLAHMVRLHGVLFTSVGMDTFDFMKQASMKEFDQLLTSSKDINTELSFKLTVIHLFSIYHATISDTKQLSYSEVSQRALLIQSSLSLGFEFLGRLLRYVVATPSASVNYLGSVCLFFDYLRCNTVQLQYFLRYNDMHKDLVKLLNMLVKSNDYMESDYSKLVLPEEMELRGFLPLKSLYRQLPCTGVLPPEDSRTKRKFIAKMNEFARLLASPDIKCIEYHIDTKEWAVVSTATLTSTVAMDSTGQDGTVDKAHRSDGKDNVDDEVILFKPGEGVKIESEHHDHPGAIGLIGSGRGDAVKSPTDTSGMFATASFDLTPLLGSNTTTTYSSTMPTLPSTTTTTTNGLFPKFQAHPGSVYSTSVQSGFNSFFGNPNAMSSSEPLPNAPSSYWSSLPTASNPTSTHSLFSVNDAPARAENTSWITPPPISNEQQNKFEESFNPNANAQLLFPFPGNNQRYYKTRNPFIS